MFYTGIDIVVYHLIYNSRIVSILRKGDVNHVIACNLNLMKDYTERSCKVAVIWWTDNVLIHPITASLCYASIQ